MHRFFCSSGDILENAVTIADKEQIHHIRDVLHLKIGEKVEAFDEKGNEYNCVVKEIRNEVSLTIIQKITAKFNNSAELAIACAIPKNCKMEDIIDKLTQLGVNRIIPLETERVIVKMDKKKKEARFLRWQRIALSAAKQSQRSTIPVIEPIKKIKELLIESVGYDLKIIPTLIKERKSIKEAIPRSKAKKILVLIGPEGDFTPEEVDMAIESGFIPVTLGDTVLRVDTAAIAVVSFLKLNEDY